MGNILFLSGVMLTIGLKSSVQFFMKRDGGDGVVQFGWSDCVWRCLFGGGIAMRFGANGSDGGTLEDVVVGLLVLGCGGAGLC
ncbi:vesicle transport GOT1-like [Olea europaea subsp. europaea]|uniref:Vesicle transport GOT1-like n=1 Tax=Olea europaea subsp. europaea TaxID=158383 RepID=A0A8S0P6J8_OLEEU|nr:vesicle transport GOT1-like [Olea europaea subsp. europaea]